MRFLSAAVLATAFAARHPGVGETVDLSASADTGGRIDSVAAMAVRGATVTSKQVWVKAKEHFFVSGEVVQAGDYAQVPDTDAAQLVNRDFAERATDADVAAAEAAEANGVVKGKA